MWGERYYLEQWSVMNYIADRYIIKRRAKSKIPCNKMKYSHRKTLLLCYFIIRDGKSELKLIKRLHATF